MIPGKAKIITCPHCGKEKEIMSLVSGNTFNSTLWSDNKHECPMLSTVSYVQKCPECGKYYIYSRQEDRYGEVSSLETGYLDYPEMKEALAQLLEEDLLKGEESQVRFLFHHTYNDYYHRNNEGKEIPAEDLELFKANAQWLIDNCITDTIMKAEFYREMGDFAKALELIEPVDTHGDEFQMDAKRIIRNKIKAEISKVVVLQLM